MFSTSNLSLSTPTDEYFLLLNFSRHGKELMPVLEGSLWYDKQRIPSGLGKGASKGWEGGSGFRGS